MHIDLSVLYNSAFYMCDVTVETSLFTYSRKKVPHFTLFVFNTNTLIHAHI